MDIPAIMNEWLASFLLFFPKLIAAIVIFILTLLAASIPAKAIRKVASRRIKSPEVLKLIKQISQWTVVIIGTIVALDQVDFNVTGFVAGLGIAGFTIGFALQDIARNFISGMILLYRQPFTIGDFIEVSGHTGTVKMINIRDTEIETLDGDIVIIPNNKSLRTPLLTCRPLGSGGAPSRLGWVTRRMWTAPLISSWRRSRLWMEWKQNPRR
jgi:small conductance mechanosensitive channel